jgi:predicted secreted protein
MLVTLAVLAASSASAQNDTSKAAAPTAAAPLTCPLEKGTTVLSTEFSSTGEKAGIMLQAGCVYWATTDVSGIQLQLKPRTSGTQMPYLGKTMSGGGVSGGQTWEIRVTTSGEFQIWATGQPRGRAVKLSVTVRGSVPAKK